MRLTRAYRASEDAGEVAFAPALGQELLGGAREPSVAVAILKALFEQRFEDAGGAVRMLPDEVLRVELGPILFEDTVVGVEVAPHLRLRVRRDDRDLRDVQMERGKRAQVFSDGLRSFLRQADDVIAVRVESGGIEFVRQLERGLDLFVLFYLLEGFLVEAFVAEQGAFHAGRSPLFEITEEEIDERLHEPLELL